MEEQTYKFINKGLWIAQILVVGVLVFFVGQLILQNKSVDLQNANQITVSGEGKVYVKPDIAVADLGVKTTGLTTSDVLTRSTQKMNVVIKAIKDQGVEEKDIQTTTYNLYPQYNWTEAAGRVFQGYTLEQGVTVKIRDFTKVGEILKQAVAGGANLTSNLQFTLENPEQAKQEARAKAIVRAKENAKNLAKDSGVSLGKLINVYENYYPVYSATKAIGMGGGVAESVPAPMIEPGQQEINVTINLTYQVR